MSFGFSVADFVSIANLAWTTYQACKNAGGEYQILSHEVKSLHIALDRLKDEAEKPGSLVRLDIDRHSRKTRRIWFNCDDVLREVDGLMNKHESLGMSKKKMWDRLQFSAKDLGDIRSKIAANTNVINVYIGIVGLGSLGRLEQQSHINKEELLRIQEKIDRLAAEFRVANREGSILTTYSNDHKETWKEFRRSLISNGIKSDSLTRYGPEIKSYLMQLTKNGMLDEQAYDSGEFQEEFDTEPTTNHFLEPAEVSETPTQSSPSGRTNQASGTEVSPLPLPEQPVPSLNPDTQSFLTGSTVPGILSSDILHTRHRPRIRRDPRGAMIEKSRTDQEMAKTERRRMVNDWMHHQNEEVVSSVDSSVLSNSQLSPRRTSGDQYSSRSGTSNAWINNPKLIETVEEAIRRLVLPNLKHEQKMQQNRCEFYREVSLLPQPEQPAPSLNPDTQHSLTGSTVPGISSTTDATRFTLPYRRIGRERKQDLKPDTNQLHVKEAVPKKAVEVTFAMLEPAVNQPPSNMDGFSSNHSQLGYRAEGNDRGLDRGPSTQSFERFSPPASTPNAFTIPAAEPISVLTEADSDENSETSSVKENKLSSSNRPVSEFEPAPISKPATEPERDSIETISSETPDRLPRVLSLIETVEEEIRRLIPPVATKALINEPKLIERAEEPIRRMIPPVATNLKHEPKMQQNRYEFDREVSPLPQPEQPVPSLNLDTQPSLTGSTVPKILSSDILIRTHRPRIRRDPRDAMMGKSRTDQEMAKTERRRMGNDWMRKETDSEEDEATREPENAQMHEEIYKEHEPIRTREKITKAQGEEVDKPIRPATQKVQRAHRRRRSKSPAQDGRFYIQDRSGRSNEYVNKYVLEEPGRSAMLQLSFHPAKKGEPTEGDRMREGTDDEATRQREKARREREEAQMGEEMYKEYEPIGGREKMTKAHGEEVEKPAEQQRRRYKERRGDRYRNPPPKTNVISSTAAVAAIIMAGMTITRGLERR